MKSLVAQAFQPVQSKLIKAGWGDSYLISLTRLSFQLLVILKPPEEKGCAVTVQPAAAGGIVAKDLAHLAPEAGGVAGF